MCGTFGSQPRRQETYAAQTIRCSIRHRSPGRMCQSLRPVRGRSSYDPVDCVSRGTGQRTAEARDSVCHLFWVATHSRTSTMVQAAPWLEKPTGRVEMLRVLAELAVRGTRGQ